MKFKLIFLFIILFCCPIFSQENYEGLRVVTWEEIQRFEYTIVSDDDDYTVIIVNGETVIIDKL